jgi:hypothetical protein
MSELTIIKLTQEKIDLIAQTLCKGATGDELALFAAVCDRTDSIHSRARYSP